MQQWMNQHPIFIPFYFAGSFVFVFYWIALASGWRLLAKRFRMQGTFTGEKWTRQSVHFRTFAQYNRALTSRSGQHRIVHCAHVDTSSSGIRRCLCRGLKFLLRKQSADSFSRTLNCGWDVQKKFPSESGQHSPPKSKLQQVRAGPRDITAQWNCSRRRLGEAAGLFRREI